MEVAAVNVPVGVFFGLVLVFFLILVAVCVVFWLGVITGRMMENGSRGLFGVKKGKIVLGEAGPEEETGVEDYLNQQFKTPEWFKDRSKARQGHHDPEAAMREVDQHVQRFIDSAVFGRGPQRGRTGDEEDDL